MPSLNYKEAGVNIDAGNLFVDKITTLVEKTRRPEVMSSLGGYGGLFKLDLQKYKKPIIVSTTDGVGTKLKLAIDLQKYDTIGIDLVGMCVNDLICCGAEPVFFLDYFATGLLELGVGEKIISGIATCLSEINCSLLGGETAEMPGLYNKGDFDLAGFAVGLVEEDKILNPKNCAEGDVLIGLSSSGIHSNGYSLVRKIFEKHKIDIKKDTLGLSQPVGYEALTPTRIYVNPVMALLKENTIKGIAHITGGGLIENLPRVFPEHLTAEITKKYIPVPPIFKILQDLETILEAEMFRVFNMGIGLVLIVPKNEETVILQKLNTMNFPAQKIGELVSRKKKDEEVVIL